MPGPKLYRRLVRPDDARTFGIRRFLLQKFRDDEAGGTADLGERGAARDRSGLKCPQC
jgi:hypothetical protein